jgi:AcrR family transcriptional regulator
MGHEFGLGRRKAEDMGADKGSDGGSGNGGKGDDKAIGLPASLAMAWGLRSRPSRGPKPALALDRIVAAAVDLAENEGLDAVSMSRVARELGAATMSLYRYVDSKDDLLTLMMDAAFAAAPPVQSPGENWRAGLTRWAWGHLTVLRKHPWVLRVATDRPPAGPYQVMWLEHGLRFVADTGLPAHERLSVVVLLSGFVRSWAGTSANVHTAVEEDSATEHDMIASYGDMLAAFIDTQRFPALAEILAAGVMDREDPPENEFVFGLDRLLDGIETLILTSAAESTEAAQAP